MTTLKDGHVYLFEDQKGGNLEVTSVDGHLHITKFENGEKVLVYGLREGKLKLRSGVDSSLVDGKGFAVVAELVDNQAEITFLDKGSPSFSYKNLNGKFESVQEIHHEESKEMIFFSGDWLRPMRRVITKEGTVLKNERFEGGWVEDQGPLKNENP